MIVLLSIPRVAQHSKLILSTTRVTLTQYARYLPRYLRYINRSKFKYIDSDTMRLARLKLFVKLTEISHLHTKISWRFIFLNFWNGKIEIS